MQHTVWGLYSFNKIHIFCAVQYLLFILEIWNIALISIEILSVSILALVDAFLLLSLTSHPRSKAAELVWLANPSFGDVSSFLFRVRSKVILFAKKDALFESTDRLHDLETKIPQISSKIVLCLIFLHNTIFLPLRLCFCFLGFYLSLYILSYFLVVLAIPRLQKWM